MIDVYNEMFTLLTDAVQAAYPDCDAADGDVETAASLPLFTVEETNNTTYVRSLDDEGEKHVELEYTLQAFDKEKDVCKNILKIANDLLIAQGFVRTFFNFIPNADPTIKRLVARYRAVIGTDGKIYQ